MNFDVKDIKSWSNRHDVHIGDKGYFSNYINQLQNDMYLLSSTVDGIVDDTGFCFVPKGYGDGFAFFLPVDAVKEDKPKEKEYRPFKDLYEFYKFLVTSPFAKENFCKEMLLRFPFTYREKSTPQCSSLAIINRIDFDFADDPCLTCINNKDFKNWFDNYEIMNIKGKWQPFGVEVKNED